MSVTSIRIEGENKREDKETKGGRTMAYCQASAPPTMGRGRGAANLRMGGAMQRLLGHGKGLNAG